MTPIFIKLTDLDGGSILVNVNKIVRIHEVTKYNKRFDFTHIELEDDYISVGERDIHIINSLASKDIEVITVTR